MLDADELTTSGSPAWWLIRLGKALDADRVRLDRLHRYDCGDHDLPMGHPRAREAFKRFQQESRSNFVGLVTEAVTDRLRVEGFRMGGQADTTADERAQLIWQANHMDADSGLVMRDAVVMGRSYVIVGPAGVQDIPLITTEDPRMVVHESDPKDRRTVRAALKAWRDSARGFDYAVVYLPESVHYYRAKAGSETTGSALWAETRWEVDVDEGEDGAADNPTPGRVPVVPFVNRPEKRRMGFGEFEDVIDIQNRINQGILDRLATGAAQAFRQRHATGVDLSGESFDPGADLLWWVEDENAKFGEFEAADLRMFIDATKADTELMASISRTPPYYLLGSMSNISGDALTAADAGLTAKVRNRMLQFGESWEQVQRLAFQVVGEEAAVDAETIWADPERQSLAAQADAALKKHTIGVPWRQLMEDLGYSPQQINRMESMRASDAFLGLLNPATPDQPVVPAEA